jgi:hypothetical protein
MLTILVRPPRCMSTEDALGEAETEDQQRERLHTSARGELLDRQFSNSEAYDKAILTLSSGFLALSLSFIKEIFPAGSITCRGLLYASWALLALAIISTVISFRVSNAAIEGQLGQAHRYYKERDESAFTKSKLSRSVDWLNNVSGGLFIFGVVLTVVFVILNFSEEKSMSNKSGGGPTRIDEGHSVPTMQKVVVEPLEKGQSVPQMQQVTKPQAPAAKPEASPAATPATQSPGLSQPAAKK